MMNDSNVPPAGARRRCSPDDSQVPKLCGADVELGNFVAGSAIDNTGRIASRALLREIRGYPPTGREFSVCNCPSCTDQRQHQYTGKAKNSVYRACASGTTCDSSYNSLDWGRKFLAQNGGCVYIDLDHLELCLPEVISA